MSFQDLMSKIPPQALLGLAQGLLSPGPSQGARFGQGIAGMSQGMLMAQMMQERAMKQDRERQQMEALKRLGNPKAYEDDVSAANTDLANPASPLSVTPSKFSQSADMMSVAPEATVSAMLNPKEVKLDNYNVTGPDGKTRKAQLSSNQAMALQSKGFTVEAAEKASNTTDPWKNYQHVGSNLYEMGPNGRPKLAVSGEGPQGTKAAFDMNSKSQVFVTDSQIKSNPSRYVPVPSGMKLESDRQGGFKFVTGDMAVEGAHGLTNTSQTEVQKNAIAANEGVARLQTIQSRFKPEFQQIGTRWDAYKTALKDKAGMAVDQQSALQLKDFSGFKSDAIDNINKYIKDTTGASMTIQEAQRIMRGVPNPGSGILDGDSPIEFKSKMDATMERLRLASARMTYAAKNGLTQKQAFSTPIESMRDIIDRRGDQLKQDLQAQSPGTPAQQIDELVHQQLKQEFGF